MGKVSIYLIIYNLEKLMKNLIQSILFVLAILFASNLHAAGETQTFSRCLVDALNGKERKALAKWIFFAIAAHPEIKPFSNATPEVIEESDKFVGALVSRLLINDCPNQLKDAIKVDPSAIEKAFELVGQVAMQELMNSPGTNAAITNYIKYTDQEKLQTLLSE